MTRMLSEETHPNRKGFEKLPKLAGRTGTGVYYLGLFNWINNTQADLYIGEEKQALHVMERQKEYFVKVQGMVCLKETEEYATFSHRDKGSPVFTLSIVELEEDKAQKFEELKKRAQAKRVPFYGIVTGIIDNTDILHPVDPSTGRLEAIED